MQDLLLTATKEYVWDCAHMLAGHQGLCQNLHGHTYKLQVTVGRIKEHVQTEGPSEGMVIDFKDLKELITNEIVSKFDHALVVNVNTTSSFEEALIKLAEMYDKKLVKLEYRPTAELMVVDFFERVQKVLVERNSSIRIMKMRLYETPTSYAEISM